MVYFLLFVFAFYMPLFAFFLFLTLKPARLRKRESTVYLYISHFFRFRLTTTWGRKLTRVINGSRMELTGSIRNPFVEAKPFVSYLNDRPDEGKLLW